MRRGLTVLTLAALLAVPMPRVQARGPGFTMPVFPMPKLVRDQFGQTKRFGFLSFLRELNAGGVHDVEETDFLDSDYAVIESSSLPMLAAWLEATCGSVGFDLRSARSGTYDGTVTARLLDIGATLAAVRGSRSSLAMPIGILICRRRRDWGRLAGDGGRDAYALIATERGLMVYDPPTRQLVSLSQFPNASDILNIQF